MKLNNNRNKKEDAENSTLIYTHTHTHTHTYTHTHTFTHTHTHTHTQVSLCGVFSQVWSALSVTGAGRIQRGKCSVFFVLFTNPYLLLFIFLIFLILIFQPIKC